MCKWCIDQDRRQRINMGNGGINIVCGFEQICDWFWRQYDMYIVPNRISKQCWWHWWCDAMLQQHQEPCLVGFCGERRNTNRMHGDGVEFLQQIGL